MSSDVFSLVEMIANVLNSERIGETDKPLIGMSGFTKSAMVRPKRYPTSQVSPL